MQRIGSLFLLCIVLAACVATPPQAQPTSTPQASPPPHTTAGSAGDEGGATITLSAYDLSFDASSSWHVREEQDSARLVGPTEDMFVDVRPLQFAGRGDTFLAAVDEAARAHRPQERRLLIAETGEILGEMFLYADRVEAFVQPPGDWRAGVHLSGPRTDEVLAILASARPLEPNSTPPADVDIQFVRARWTGQNAWSFDVRLRHPDTGWEDYADGWQIVTPDGLVLGTRILLHPHEREQPFTRSLGGVDIPPEIGTVRVVAHDLVSGYTLSPFTIPLDASTTEEHYQVER